MIKPSRSKLEPFDLDTATWHKQIVSVPFASDDRIVEYQGQALVCEPATAHFIDFQFRTTAIRPTEVSIPLLVSSSASVTLEVNDSPVTTFEMTVIEPSLIRWIVLDVTRWTEPCVSCKLQLLISYHAAKGTTIIPLGNEPKLQPEVLQKWNWLYALKSLAFFGIAWSSIIALAFLIVAHIQPLGETFHFYAIVVAVLTWVGGVIGLPDAARIPLRSTLRRLYGKTRSEPSADSWFKRKRRGLCLSIALVFCILVGYGTQIVIRCISIHYQYSRLIHRAMQETDSNVKANEIQQALILVPWRKEAQILFEGEAYETRNLEDMSGLREYDKRFANQQSIKQAIINTPADLPFWLTRSESSTFLHDPVVWYASVIIETDDKTLIKEAASILEKRTDPLAQIELWTIKLIIVNDEAIKVGENKVLSQAELEHELEQIRTKYDFAANELRWRLEQNKLSLRDTYVFQVGCDTLAGYYLDICDNESAKHWYWEEFSARQNQIALNGEQLWLRPPDKLVLFWMFATHWTNKGEGVKTARCLLEDRDCPNPRGDSKCDFRSTFEDEFWKDNKEYQDESAWLRRTIRGPGLADAIEESLKKGWRY